MGAAVDKDVEDLLDCVHAMLRAGLLDERHGAYFRYRIREWARRGTDLSARFHSLLVRLCAEVIAPLHPARPWCGYAIWRTIRTPTCPNTPSTRSTNSRASGCSCVASYTSSGRSSENNAFAMWSCSSGSSIPVGCWTAGHGRPLLTDRVVRDQLIDCWRLVQRHDLDVWEGGAYSWFTAALDSADRDSVLALLVQAAGEDGLAVSRLEHAREDMGAEHPGRSASWRQGTADRTGPPPRRQPEPALPRPTRRTTLDGQSHQPPRRARRSHRRRHAHPSWAPPGVGNLGVVAARHRPRRGDRDRIAFSAART